MPVDRSETLPAALPPTDHVARVLLKRGARDDALTFLRAAVARDPGERACAALLRAVEARPDASVYGPDLALDVSLVEAYTRSGMLIEALAVLRGGELDETARGRHRAAVLEELLAPCPVDADEELRDADAELRLGGAAVALSVLGERIARDPGVPAWARRRYELLSELLLEQAEPAPEPAGPRKEPRTPLGEALSAAFARRDVEGALEAAQTIAREHAGDLEPAAVAEALGRLRAAMHQASRDAGGPMLSTQPMTGHTTALFQLRMGNLAEAERFFRRIVLEEPLDRLARQRLEDVQTVRAAMDGPSRSSSPPAPAAARIDPLLETGRAWPVLERAPIAAPTNVAFKQTTPLDSEVTRSVSGGALGERGQPAVPEPTLRDRPMPDPVTVEVSLDAVTKEVDLTAAARRESPREATRGSKKPSSPELLKKRELKVTGEAGWAVAESARMADWEDDSTEVGSPEEQAELILRQGYTERALGIYEALIRAAPDRDELRQRRDEIRALLAAEDEPATSAEIALPDARSWDEEEATLVTESRVVEEPEPEVRVHRIIRIG